MTFKDAPTAPELLSAIHRHCLDCCGGYRKKVQRCKLENCALHPFRIAEARPKEVPVKGQVNLFEILEKVSC